MTPENQAKLLRAYEAALGTETTPDEIADLLRDVILGEMEQEKPSITYRNAPNVMLGDGPAYDNLNKVTRDAKGGSREL